MLKKSKYRGITMDNAIEVFYLMYADNIGRPGRLYCSRAPKKNKHPSDIL